MNLVREVRDNKLHLSSHGSAWVILSWACVEVTNRNGQVFSAFLEYALELPAALSTP